MADQVDAILSKYGANPKSGDAVDSIISKYSGNIQQPQQTEVEPSGPYKHADGREPFQPDPNMSEPDKAIYNAGPGLMADAALLPVAGAGVAMTGKGLLNGAMKTYGIAKQNPGLSVGAGALGEYLWRKLRGGN